MTATIADATTSMRTTWRRVRGNGATACSSGRAPSAMSSSRAAWASRSDPKTSDLLPAVARAPGENDRSTKTRAEPAIEVEPVRGYSYRRSTEGHAPSARWRAYESICDDIAPVRQQHASTLSIRRERTICVHQGWDCRALTRWGARRAGPGDCRQSACTIFGMGARLAGERVHPSNAEWRPES
jgi:hypothetical protein